MTWVVLNAQWAMASGVLKFEHKPMAVDQCSYNFDETLITAVNSTLGQSADDIFPLYRISYMWYTFFGALVAITVAHLTTTIFGCNDTTSTDPNLLAPFLRKRYNEKKRRLIHGTESNNKILISKMAPLQCELEL